MDMKTWAKNWLGLELFKSVKASSWWIRVGYISQLRWTSQTTGRHFVAVGPVEPWPACDLSRPHGDFGYQVWPQKKALSNKMSQEGLQHWDPCEAVWRLGGPVRFGSHHQRVIKWKPDIGGWFLQVLDLRMEIKHEFLYIYIYICIYICIHILSNQLINYNIYIYMVVNQNCVWNVPRCFGRMERRGFVTGLVPDFCSVMKYRLYKHKTIK